MIIISALLIICTYVCAVTAASFVGRAEDIITVSQKIKETEWQRAFLVEDYQIELFEKSIQNLEDEICKRDLNATLWGLVSGKSWAITMYDSSAKSFDGIEYGSIFHFGNFDECLDSNSDLPQNDDFLLSEDSFILPQYCLVDITVEGIVIKLPNSRKNNNLNSTIIHWGICVPSTCGKNDLERLMTGLLGYSTTVIPEHCQLKQKLEVSKGMALYLCFMLFIVMIVLLSSIYHFYLIRQRYSEKELGSPYKKIILSFSILENGKKLLQPNKNPSELALINGVKVLSMLCILFGHSVAFKDAGPVINEYFYAKDMEVLQNAFVLNSPLFVDTFLFLGGFLFCRILLQELEKRQGNVNYLILYIGRFMRLTPAYFVVIIFYVTWLPEIGSGPTWYKRVILEQKRCQESWWHNILYINNYVGNDNLCMFQSWYLSVDTQLFIISSVFIHILWKSKRIGIFLLSILTSLSVIVPFIDTYVNGWDPTLLSYSDEIYDFATNSFFINAYIKTHMRATAYCIGLLAAYVLHHIQKNGIIIPRYLVRILWILSLSINTICLYSLVVFTTAPFTKLESALYASLHRLGWSLGTAWVIIAAATSNGKYVNRFLSYPAFVPLSRLTYCAYLTNGLVELYRAGTIRSPFTAGRVNNLCEGVADIVATFLLAIVLCLCFESPIHGIEKMLLARSHKKLHIEDKNGKIDSVQTSEETIS